MDDTGALQIAPKEEGSVIDDKTSVVESINYVDDKVDDCDGNEKDINQLQSGWFSSSLEKTGTGDEVEENFRTRVRVDIVDNENVDASVSQKIEIKITEENQNEENVPVVGERLDDHETPVLDEIQSANIHNSMYISDITPNINAHSLIELFGKFGTITGCTVKNSPKYNHCFAFMEFSTRDSLVRALNSEEPHICSGITVHVSERLPSKNDKKYSTTPKQDTDDPKVPLVDAQEQESIDNPSNTMFVKELTHKINEKHLRQAFYKFGSISSCRIVGSTGFAFIDFSSRNSLLNAINQVKPHICQGVQILVEEKSSDGALEVEQAKIKARNTLIYRRENQMLHESAYTHVAQRNHDNSVSFMHVVMTLRENDRNILSFVERDYAPLKRVNTWFYVHEFSRKRKRSVSYLEYMQKREDKTKLIPIEIYQRMNYMTTLQLFQWAHYELNIPLDERSCESASFGGHLSILKWLHSRRGRTNSQFSVCRAAAYSGHLHILQWARSQSTPYPWHEKTCLKAALQGNLDVLRWLRAQKPPCPWNANVCGAAAQEGHLHILKWARAQNPPCPWKVDVCQVAAQEGHFEVLKWARAQNPPAPWDEEVCANAAFMNRMDIMKWLRSQDPPCPWDETSCSAAAQEVSGTMTMLKWIRGQIPVCPWDKTTCIHAALTGKLDMLKWIKLQTSSYREWWAEDMYVHAAEGGHLTVINWLISENIRIPKDTKLLTVAARGGHFKIIKWARSLNPPCKWNEDVCIEVASQNRLDILRWIRDQKNKAPWNEDVCAAAAKEGHIGILKWLRAQSPPCPWDTRVAEYSATDSRLSGLKWALSLVPPCPWDQHIQCEAAKGGHLKTLRWLHSHNFLEEWHPYICTQAASMGRLPVLKWLLDQNPPAPFHVKAMMVSAKSGYLDIIKWAREENNPKLPWCEGVCYDAAQYGQLEVLQWVRSQDPPCPWDEKVCKFASLHGHLHILKWVRSQDPPCPWDENVCILAARKKFIDILLWLQQVPDAPWVPEVCDPVLKMALQKPARN